VADAGPDQTVTDTDGNASETVTLDGSGSFDPDGTIASYVWTEGGSQIATGAMPAVPFAVGAHTITLTVTDDDGATDTDTVVITVEALAPPPNEAPTADAGPDQTVTDTDGDGSETVTLDGNGSSDPDGDLLTFEWKEGSTVLGTAEVISPNLAVGSHTITLSVSDGEYTDTDAVVITVEAPAPPPAEPTLSVASLDGSAKAAGKTKWSASVKATIVDEAGGPVSGATVHFEVDPGSAVTCVTGRKGTCSVSTDKVGTAVDSFTFTVMDVVLAGWVYEPDTSTTSATVTSPL
jgi:hypothetical protein